MVNVLKIFAFIFFLLSVVSCGSEDNEKAGVTIEQDTDGDGTPDSLDTDDDDDGYADTEDAFPLDANEWADLDSDGIGDNLDTDDNGNGIDDIIEDYKQEIFDLESHVSGVTDTVFLPEKNLYFLALKNSNSVVVIDADNGSLQHTFDFDFMAERVELSHDKSTLYVTLLEQEHNSYWWEEEQQGRVAVIDVETMTVIDTLRLDIDPFDIVAIKDNLLVVSSGSGQWTNLNVYNAATGVQIAQAFVRQASYLSYSAEKNWVFSADTDLSPSNFQKFGITDSTITGLGDSPYHGDHRVNGRAWVNTSGTHVITRGGDLFNASNMEYVKALTTNDVTIENVFFDNEQDVAFLGLSNSNLVILNQNSLIEIETMSLFGRPIAIGASGYFTYTLVESGNILSIVKNLHPCLTCNTNTAPNAEFLPNPSAGDTNTNFSFSADLSSDNETPNDLQYRWDFDSDGEWDTSFSNEVTIEHKFLFKGTKYVRMQVKDKHGRVDTFTKSIDVAQGLLEATSISVGSGNGLNFATDQSTFIQTKSQAIHIDQDSKRVYFTDLIEGKALSYFEFDHYPAHFYKDLAEKYLYIVLTDQLEVNPWGEEETENIIAVIDLETEQWIDSIKVSFQPNDIVATNSGRIFVTGIGYDYGSVYELSRDDGSIVDSIWFDYNAELYLLPDEEYLLARDSNSHWVGLLKLHIGQGNFVEDERQTVQLAEYSNEFWLSSDGKYLFTQQGDVINTSTLEIVTNLLIGEQVVKQVVFDDERNLFFVLTENGKLLYFNQTSLFEIESIDVPTLVTEVFVVANELLLFTTIDYTEWEIIRNPHPCIECGSNTAPIAIFTYSPEMGDTADTYLFDASNSTDAEDTESLKFRWDVEGDGTYETEFAESSVFQHMYHISDNYSPTVQVKDSGGLVATYSANIEVLQGQISPTVVEDSTANYLDFDITDSVFDSERGRFYFTDKDDYKLYIYDIESGKTQFVFEFENKPENMTLNPNNSKLYVSLLVQEHSSYWWEEDQKGYIAVIDLEQLVWNEMISIDMDPYDIQVNDDYLYVTSGSGQWTNIGAYEFSTEQFTFLSNSIYQMSEIVVSNESDDVFVLDGNDIEKYERQGTSLNFVSRTNYEEFVRDTNKVWLSPDGSSFISSGGQLIKTTNLALEADLTHGLANVEQALFDEDNKLLFLVTNEGEIEYYNSTSFEYIDSLGSINDAKYIYIYNSQLFVIHGEGREYSIEIVTHPCLTCGSNIAPTAVIDVTTESPSTGDAIEFDGSQSSDFESDSELLFRWDFDGDGTWDTPFLEESVIEKEFVLKGKKTIRMQVKDEFGLVSEDSIEINILQSINYGSEVESSEAYKLETEIEDLYFDKSRNRLYISDRAVKKLYVVNIATGLTERSFTFSMDIGSIAVSPDEMTMYIAMLSEQTRSCCWDDNEQYGYIARFDLASLGWEDTYEVSIDPYDMVASDSGNLIISSGSGQWTRIKNFDAETGEELYYEGIRHMSKLAMHPDQDKVFAADTDLSPSDIEKFSFNSSMILSEGDSPYHGDVRIGGNVWVTPDGEHLITRGGDVFLTTDMSYVTSLDTDMNLIEALTFGDNTVTTAMGYDGVYQYSLDDYSLLSSNDTLHSFFIFNNESDIYYVEDNGLGVEFKQVQFD